MSIEYESRQSPLGKFVGGAFTIRAGEQLRESLMTIDFSNIASTLASYATWMVALHLIAPTVIVALAAFLAIALQARLSLITLGTFWLGCWTVYAADRYIRQPEDDSAACRQPSHGASPRTIRGLLILAILLQLILAFMRPVLVVGIVIEYLLSFAYMLRVPGLRRRVKTLPFIKAIYLLLVMIVTTLVFFQVWPCNLFQLTIMIGVGVLFSSNVTICDIKDCSSDAQAGIRTLANTIGPARTIRIVQIVCSMMAVALLLLGGFRPLSLSLTAGLFLMAAVALPLNKPVPFWWYFFVVDGVFLIPLLLFKILS